MPKRRKFRDAKKRRAAGHGPAPAPVDPYQAAIRDAATKLETGDPASAETLLNTLEPERYDRPEALHLLGLARVRLGRIQEGLSMLERSVRRAPEAPWMRVNLAAVRQGRGEHAQAIAHLEAAVAQNPKMAEAWTNLAASRSMQGDYAGAADAARNAVDAAPKSAAALQAYGNTLIRADDFDGAAKAYRRLLAVEPANMLGRVSLLQALHRAGRDDEARAETEIIAHSLGGRLADDEAGRDRHIDAALAKGVENAVNADAVVAMALVAVGQFERALEAAEKAAASAPGDPYGWAALGMALHKQKRNVEAIEPFERALEIRPDWPEVRGTLGSVYWLAERSEEAARLLERAVKAQPGMAALWGTLGAARRDLRDCEGAVEAYKRALELEPGNGKFALSLALTQIRMRNFAEGHVNYERRWETPAFADQARPHTHPLWQGEDLTGKKILVYAEQGVGDEIMCAGMLSQLVDMGAAVYFESNARMTELFERSLPGVVNGRSQNPVLPAFTSPDFDYQVPMGTLMARLAPDYADLKPRGAYLKADPAKVEALRNRYRDGLADSDLLVGVAWRSGNPTSGGRRTADLNLWGPVLEQPGARFVNLQYGDCADEIAAARDVFGADIIEDAAVSTDGDLDSFAAQVAACDLIVSIDNSTIHFAGALGVPTLMLLNYEPDWRWFGGDEGNPWYECVAHIRQEEPGLWGPVMQAAGEVVAGMAAAGEPPVATDALRPAMVNRGARPKAFLLNDTTAWYHWGCTATSLAIRDQLHAKGYDVGAGHIREVYRARPAPKSLADFDDPAFFRQFADANPALIRRLVESDRVVVNGEGTLHGTSENVLGLLYLIHAAAKHLGKATQIINHSCYPEDQATITNALANGLYRKVYAGAEYVAFREHLTHGLMARIGVEGALAFDSLPLTAKRMKPDLTKLKGKRLVIAGGVTATEDVAAAFAEYARWAAERDWQVVLLTGARAFPAADEAAFLQAIARHGLPAGAELVTAPTLERWMAEIASAGMVTTARFHHSIAAFSLGVPFVAASSNTAKVDALMQLLERPAPLATSTPNLSACLIEAHLMALDRQEGPLDHAARLEAVETLAMENYARL